jgi:hypothetical protein
MLNWPDPNPMNVAYALKMIDEKEGSSVRVAVVVVALIVIVALGIFVWRWLR